MSFSFIFFGFEEALRGEVPADPLARVQIPAPAPETDFSENRDLKEPPQAIETC